MGVNWLMILFPSAFRKPLLSIAYFLFRASNWKPYQVKQRHFKAKAVNVYLQSGKEQALLSTFLKKKRWKKSFSVFTGNRDSASGRAIVHNSSFCGHAHLHKYT